MLGERAEVISSSNKVIAISGGYEPIVTIFPINGSVFLDAIIRARNENLLAIVKTNSVVFGQEAFGEALSLSDDRHSLILKDQKGHEYFNLRYLNKQNFYLTGTFVTKSGNTVTITKDEIRHYDKTGRTITGNRKGHITMKDPVYGFVFE